MLKLEQATLDLKPLNRIFKYTVPDRTNYTRDRDSSISDVLVHSGSVPSQPRPCSVPVSGIVCSVRYCNKSNQ